MSMATFCYLFLLIGWWHLVPWLFRLMIFAVVKHAAKDVMKGVSANFGSSSETMGKP